MPSVVKEPLKSVSAICICGDTVGSWQNPTGHRPDCPVHQEWRKANYNPPGIIGKAANLINSTIAHIAAGSPESTDELVSYRFGICQSCELFKSVSEGQGQCMHPSCGCTLKRVGLTGLNKLRRANEHCPIGKW